MKLSHMLMWVLYGVVASTIVSMLDIHFGWNLFTWAN